MVKNVCSAACAFLMRKILLAYMLADISTQSLTGFSQFYHFGYMYFAWLLAIIDVVPAVGFELYPDLVFTNFIMTDTRISA